MSQPAGRPSVYSEDVASKIFLRLCQGESLRSICRDEDMPARSTVLLWVVEDREGFSGQYARARQVQALEWADEILEIADDGTNDVQETDRGPVTDHDVIARSRLRVDTRKWLLARVLPKVYGDKSQVEVASPGGGPIEVVVTRRVLSPKNRIASQVGEGGHSSNGHGRP